MLNVCIAILHCRVLVSSSDTRVSVNLFNEIANMFGDVMITNKGCVCVGGGARL